MVEQRHGRIPVPRTLAFGVGFFAVAVFLVGTLAWGMSGDYGTPVAYGLFFGLVVLALILGVLGFRTPRRG